MDAGSLATAPAQTVMHGPPAAIIPLCDLSDDSPMSPRVPVQQVISPGATGEFAELIAATEGASNARAINAPSVLARTPLVWLMQGIMSPGPAESSRGALASDIRPVRNRLVSGRRES